MENRKPTVLFLEWSTSGREFDIACPLMYVFERHLGWNVEYKCQFNFLDVLRTRPNLVIMSGTVGAASGLAWAKRISDSGIPLVSHVTEGIYRSEDIEAFVYGWASSEQPLPEKRSMLWSDFNRELAINAFPNLEEKLAVSGAVGFDKYSFLTIKRKEFKSRDKEHVAVGYSGFDFNRCLAGLSENKDSDQGSYKHLLRSKSRCRDYLRAMVVNNPEVNFIFKPHPGDGLSDPPECAGLEVYKNFCIATDPSMVNFLSQVDMLVSFNSTTTIDAWAMNIPAVVLNDDQRNLSNDGLSEAIRLQHPIDFNKYVDLVRGGASLRQISDGNAIDRIIARTIGSADGMNHLRFCAGISDVITESLSLNSPSKINANFKFIIFSLTKTLVFYVAGYLRFVPYFNKRFLIYKTFSFGELNRNKSLYYECLDLFYSERSEDIKKYLAKLSVI